VENYTVAGFKIIGKSVAGIGTSLIFPEMDFCFDVAQGASKYYMPINHFLVSHGHMDHAAGIPFIASQKSLNRLKEPVFYMPENMIEPLTSIMRLWMKIEDHEYPFKFVPIEADREYPLKGDLFFKPFPTVHRIPSFGYTVFRRSRKLKASLADASQDEIIDLRKKGTDIHDVSEVPLLSFTGDTKIEFLESRPWVLKSKVLFVEATYIDDRKTVEEARTWGHIHLDEVIPNLSRLECEKIVLIHFSSRYSRAEIHEILDKKIPPEHKDRVVALIPD